MSSMNGPALVESVQRWREAGAGAQDALKEVFRQLYPILQMRVGREFHRLSLHDREELAQTASQFVWRDLCRIREPPWTNRPNGLFVWFHPIIRSALLQALPLLPRSDQDRAPEDQVLAYQALYGRRRWGSIHDLENTLTAWELPGVVESRVLQHSRLPEADEEALRYVIREFMQGTLREESVRQGCPRVLGYLKHVMGLSFRKARFIVDYGVVWCRHVLLQQLQYREQVLLNPDGVMVTEEELEESGGWL